MSGNPEIIVTITSIEKCNQVGCENPGAYRFTWPGQDEQQICAEHAPKLRSVASAMGLHLQLIPVETTSEAPCDS